jgi:hypothetical protein
MGKCLTIEVWGMKEARFSERFITIDLEALNAIEKVLLISPKMPMALQLKRLLGIPMTERELFLDLHNPHSFLRKYLVAMMMSLIARCLMLLDENFKRFLWQHIQMAKWKDLQAWLNEIERAVKYHKGIPPSQTLRYQLTYLNQLAVGSLAKVTLPLSKHVWQYLVEAHHYSLLNFYLNKAPKSLLPIIFDMLEQESRILRTGFETIDQLQQRSDLTPQEEAELEDIKQRLERHLELTTPDMIEKMLPHINLDDPIMMKQHVAKTGPISAMIIVHKAMEISHNLNEPSKATSLDNTPSEVPKGNVTRALLTDKELCAIKFLQDDVNDLFSVILDQSEDVIVHGGKFFLELTDKLMRILQKKEVTVELLQEAKIAAANLVNALSTIKGLDYSDICARLTKWCGEEWIAKLRPMPVGEVVEPIKEKMASSSQNLPASMEDAGREDLILLVKKIVDDTEEEALKEELTKFLQLLSAPQPITLGTIKGLMGTYNRIKKDFPSFRGLRPIHEKLTELGLVEEEGSLESTPHFVFS